MHESAFEKARKNESGATPPTSPASTPLAPPVEFVERTHMNPAVFATVAVFPIGLPALCCSSMSILRISEEKFAAAHRWGRRSRLIAIIGLANALPFYLPALFVMALGQ